MVAPGDTVPLDFETGDCLLNLTLLKLQPATSIFRVAPLTVQIRIDGSIRGYRIVLLAEAVFH